MNRRAFVTGLGALLAGARVAEAQKIYRLGVLTYGSPEWVVDATYEGDHRLVESLARPGGNVTGLGVVQPLGPKWLQLLKEWCPRRLESLRS